MRILILGCDDLAVHLASSLATEGHEITVMDPEGSRLDVLPAGLQADAFACSDSLMEDLRVVGMSNVDVFIALSNDDNRNAMAAQAASHIFHVGNVICRIRDPERDKFYRGLGINVISPTPPMADAIHDSIKDTISHGSG